MITTQEVQEAAARIGEANASILFARAVRHQDGLNLMVAPMPGRKAHNIGPMKASITPPAEITSLPSSVADTSTFLRKMLLIEQEFLAGIRKRSPNTN